MHHRYLLLASLSLAIPASPASAEGPYKAEVLKEAPPVGSGAGDKGRA